jgi:hypothetical protein
LFVSKLQEDIKEIILKQTTVTVENVNVRIKGIYTLNENKEVVKRAITQATANITEEVLPEDKYSIQFNIVKELMQREDIEEIYNAGDSGREGEYIQRLVFMMAKPNPKAKMKRVWIDSQTEDEILRGIREAKDLSEYDSLSDSAYLRAKEDYLIGINFSRLLSIIYGRNLASKINEEKAKMLYDFIDNSTFYTNKVQVKDRSIMNVPFVSPSEELDAKFVAEAGKAGLASLKGHKLVGGMRASIYNAMPIEGVKALIEFMKKFEMENK